MNASFELLQFHDVVDFLAHKCGLKILILKSVFTVGFHYF